MNNLILNQNLTFHYNPFSGLEQHDVEYALVPQFDIPTIIKKINDAEALLVEFVGKQGRGKTTHLMHLQQYFPQYPIFMLNASSNYHSILKHPSDIFLLIVFIMFLYFIE